MVFYNLSSFFSATAFFVLIQQGTCFRCFRCKDVENSPCGYPNKTHVQIQSCPYSDDVCFTYDYNIDAEKPYQQFVQRGCAREFDQRCPEPAGNHTPKSECRICDFDLCNNQITKLKRVPDDENNGNNNNDPGTGTNLSVAPIFILTSLTFSLMFKNTAA